MDDNSLTPAQRADVILNRTNVALARSQRLIQSWLPPRSPSTTTANTQDSEENEDDFKSMTEIGGVGSRSAFGEEGLPDGSLRRTKLSSNDKLLEQLLGKKAMQAKKKKDEALRKEKSGMTQAPVSKSVVNPREAKRQIESDDEEEGRAASFKSKKAKTTPTQAVASEESHTNQKTGTKTGGKGGKGKDYDSDNSEPEMQRPAKKKPGSYLDELLSQKAGKKNKKK